MGGLCLSSLLSQALFVYLCYAPAQVFEFEVSSSYRASVFLGCIAAIFAIIICINSFIVRQVTRSDITVLCDFETFDPACIQIFSNIINVHIIIAVNFCVRSPVVCLFKHLEQSISVQL